MNNQLVQYPTKEATVSLKSSLLDLNSAGRRLLTQLPGVSKTIAYRIVNFRNKHQGICNWSDVERITGLPRPTLEALQERAYIGPRHEVAEKQRPVLSRWKTKLTQR